MGVSIQYDRLHLRGGDILLLLVFLLPVQRMKDNVQRSMDIYLNEGDYPRLVWGYDMSKLDNYTDMFMLLHATYAGSGNVIEDVVKMNHTEYFEEGCVGVGSLIGYIDNWGTESHVDSYPRYWHGYLVILKPLLLLFDVADIRIFNMILFFSLLLYIMLTMQKKGFGIYILPFGVSILLLNPLVVPPSFQFSTVTYIMLFSVCIALNRSEWEFEKLFFFFMLIGIATAYFDFLTFPLVGLYFPMIFVLMKEDSWKTAFKIIIWGSIAWAIGYAGMWSGKWILGSILTGENLFANAFERFTLYSGRHNGAVSFRQLIFSNILVLLRWPMAILGAGIACLYGKNIVSAVREKSIMPKWIFPFALIAITPIVWYVASGSHSNTHYWFTYRELCVSVFAVLTGLRKVMNMK